MRKNNIFNDHTLDILKAAMPHVNPRAQGGMQVLLKASDLMSTIENGGQEGEVSAMQLEQWTPDPEEMLVSIKEVTNPGETEIVDMLLNFFKARKLYSAYQSYSDTVLEAQGISGGNGGGRRNAFNPFSMFGLGPNMGQRNRQNQNNNRNAGNVKNANAAGNAGNNPNAAGMRGNARGQMPNFMNFMMSQMSPEQKQTFDMLNMMMNNMPNNSGNMSGQNLNNSKNNNLKGQSLSDEDTSEDNSSQS